MKHPNESAWASLPMIGCCALLAIGCGDADANDTGGSGGTGAQGATGGTAGSAGAGGGGAAGGAGGAGGSGAAGTGGSSGGGGSGATGGTAGSGGSVGSGGSLGSGGTSGSGGTGGGGGTSPAACNTALTGAGKCAPEIEFQNEEANGDGAMFDQVIPDPVATMKSVACQVCTILYREPEEITRNPPTITLHIYDFDGVANAGGGTISFSSRHIRNYDNPADALFEYLGVLIHETSHLYQFDDGGGGLVEGMADFVRIRAGHHRMSRRSPGGAWTDAYTTSGFFFSWLAGPGGLQSDGRVPADPDIGWAINEQMRDNWSEQVFVDRLGQDVDTLWAEYQDAL
jgi:hypothetical protein